MNKLGFIFFNELPEIKGPTTQEILASLTGTQKILILDGFAKKIKPETLQYRIKIRNAEVVVKHLYCKIIEIEEKSRLLMRGEIVITPAEYDEEGVETKPAVYNIQPTTSVKLKDAVKVDFSDDFTETQINAILSKMILYSKHDGSGVWEFYKSEIVK